MENSEPNGLLTDLIEALQKPDPTKNVVAILETAVQRQDDLRESELAAIRREASIRAEYDEKLREAESKRIDAIRAVDVGAVNRAAEVQAQQAQTLAGQVSASAEALRNQVAAAASASTVALAAALEPISKDIADLRKSQYEALGQKTQVVENRGTGQWAIAAGMSALGLGVAIAGVVIAATP